MAKDNRAQAGVSHRYFYGWNMVIASFLIVFALWGAYYAFGVFFKSMAQEFGWTRAQTSAAMTISLLIGGLMAPIAGKLVDRYGPRLLMALSALLAGTGYVMMSTINSLIQYYFWYGLIMGLAMSGSYLIPASIINHWFIRKRGLALGLVFSAFGIAQMSMPPLATQLLSIFGWKTSYIFIGGGVFLITFISAFFLKNYPQEMGLMPDGDKRSAEGERMASWGLTFKEAIHTWGYWFIISLWLIFSIPTYIMAVHMIPYATDMKISPMIAASIFTTIGFFNIIGRIIFGHLCDRWGNKPVVLISFLAVFFGMLILMGARELWAFYLAGILYGTFYSAVDTAAIKITGDFFGNKAIATIMGTTGMAWRIGAGSGALLGGLIFDISGSYTYAFALAALSMLLSFFLSLFLFRHKSKMEQITDRIKNTELRI